jgi:hypothetical protein
VTKSHDIPIWWLTWGHLSENGLSGWPWNENFNESFTQSMLDATSVVAKDTLSFNAQKNSCLKIQSNNVS